MYEDRIHLRNRDYDPTTGTFLSKDPLGVGAEPEGRPTSANLFAYVGNDPLNYTDPLGLCRTTDVMFYFDGYKFWGPEEGYSLEQCEGSAGVECRDIAVVKPVDFTPPRVFEKPTRATYWPADGPRNAGTTGPWSFPESASGYHCQPYEPPEPKGDPCSPVVWNLSQGLGYGNAGRAIGKLLKGDLHGATDEAVDFYINTEGQRLVGEGLLGISSKVSIVGGSAATVVDAACSINDVVINR